MAPENHVFFQFGSYPALIGLIQANRGWNFDFWSNFPIKTRDKFNL